MNAGYLYLLGRVIGMGLERPLVKRLGAGFDPTAVTTLYVGLGEVVFALIVAVQVFQHPVSLAGVSDWLPLAIIPGLCYAVSFHTFIRAMRVGEVSVLTPLFATGFIMMYILDVIAGYADLAWMPLMGVLLVTLGVGFLSPPGKGSRLSLQYYLDRLNPVWVLRQPGAVLMLINAMGVAVGRYFDKTLAPEAEPVQYALAVNAPAVVIGLMLLGLGSIRLARPENIEYRAGSLSQPSCSFRELLRLIRARWPVAVTLVVFGQGAFLLALYALDYFPPSVVEPVTQLGVFIAVYLGGLWFNEPVRTRWVPSAMVVAGAVLLLL